MKRYFPLLMIVSLLTMLILFSTAVAESGNINDYVEVKNSACTSGFLYSDSFFLNGSSSMSGDLCKASAALSSAAYHQGEIESMMEQMDFKPYDNDTYTYDYNKRTLEDNDRVAYAIGTKERGGYIFYCVAIRGTVGGEWFSNFNIGTEEYTGNHAGFHLAAVKVFNHLNLIMAQDGYTDKPEQRILWFTGHSRGGAVANILSAVYTKNKTYATADHIFGYTFACPPVSKNTAQIPCSNVFNFINSGDAIPAIIPEDWDYKRYGTDYKHTFSGDLEFEMRYLAELGYDYGATYDTHAFEWIIKTLFPKENLLHEPLGRFAAMMLGALAGGKDDVPIEDILTEYGSEVLEDYIIEQALKQTGLKKLYDMFDDELSVSPGEKAFLENAINETKEMDQTAFETWLAEGNNAAILEEITKKTNIVIRTVEDLEDNKDNLEKLIEKAWDVGIILGCLMDISQNSGGDILQAIADGHSMRAYEINLNVMYLGHQAYKNITKSVVIVPDCVRTIGYECFSNSNITTIEGLDHVEAVGSYAFYNCSGLPISFAEELKTVGEYAFYNCGGLTGSIMITSGSNSIGSFAFYNCRWLEEVIISDSTEIGDFAFENCSALTSVILPMGLQTIGDSAFYCCNNLFSISLPNGLKTIGNSAFRNCYGLTSISIPDSVTAIGENAFSDCYSLTSVTLPGGLQSISTSMFARSFIESITIPDSVISIGDSAFIGCENLTNIMLPEGLKNIGTYAFSQSGLNSIVIPGSVDIINYCTFWNCPNLTSITLSEGIEEIEFEAFALTEIECVVIPDSLSYFGSSAFPSFSTLTISADNYNARDCAWEHNYKVRILGEAYEEPEELSFTYDIVNDREIKITGATQKVSGELIIPAEVNGYAVVGIDNEAFVRSDIPSVVIPDGVTEIGDYAFWFCTKLTDVTLPATLESLGMSAFAMCGNLTSIDIPEGVVEIRDDTFYGCDNLTFYVTQDSYAHEYVMLYNLPYEINTPTSNDIRYCWMCGTDQPTNATWDDKQHQISCVVCGTLIDSGNHAASCLDVRSCYGCDYIADYDMNVVRNSHIGGHTFIVHDGYHDYVCNDCGKVYWSSTHWGECSEGLCEECNGEITSTAQLNHSYDYETCLYDPAVPDQHYYTCNNCNARSYSEHYMNGNICNDCGETLNICMHNNWSSIAYIPDPDNVARHIRICVNDGCGVILGYGEHANYCDDGDDFCDRCNVEWAVTHMSLNPNYAEVDPNNPELHYYRCWDCDEILLTETHWIECSGPFNACGGCGIILDGTTGIDVKHDYAYEDRDFGQLCVPHPEDSNLHNVICSGCGKYVRSEPHFIPDAHSYGDNYCRCGAYVGEYDCSIRNHTLNSIDEDFHTEELWEGLYPDPSDPTQHFTICSCGAKITEKHTAYCYNEGKCLRCLIEFDGPYIHKYSDGVCVWCDESKSGHVEISLDTDFAELTVGMTKRLIASPSDSEFIWTSSNPTVVSVQDGMLNANSSGIAVVTCSLIEDAYTTAQCSIVVYDNNMLVLPQSLKQIEAEAFAGLSAKNVIIPNGTKSIGSRAFANCTELRLVYIPDSVSQIADNAFEGCGNVAFVCESENAATAYAVEHNIDHLIQ